MENYKLTNSGSITRLSDNACIPDDPVNADYARYLEWVAGGRTPLPVDPPTQAQRIGEVNAECRQRITARYPVEKQLSFGQGLYPLAMRDACALYINDCVTESNRLADCILAGTPAIPNWPI